MWHYALMEAAYSGDKRGVILANSKRSLMLTNTLTVLFIPVFVPWHDESAGYRPSFLAK